MIEQFKVEIILYEKSFLSAKEADILKISEFLRLNRGLCVSRHIPEMKPVGSQIKSRTKKDSYPNLTYVVSSLR